VVPVNLPGGRYAYEVTYDHRTYDAHVGEVRTILALIGLLALISGGGVFYVVGGRRLIRDHRMVMLRATRDGLTDLPNQCAFQDEFPRAVASAARYEDPFALLLLDVDHFKLINDRHGHPRGDAVLKGIARILREARPGDRPYRVGGDEFALSLAHTDAAGARTVAAGLSQSLAEADIELSIGVSALRPGLKADTLRAEADAALYEAKRQGGDQAAHFDDIRERVFVTTSEKKEAVQRLIEEERLTTVFQPIWNFDAETLLGVEALSRPDPSYGLSGPAEAFDIAEQIGQVHALDVLCVENALRSASALEPGVLLFLNLSPLTLDLDAEAHAWLVPAVERAGLRPQAVVVEVTERFGGRIASVIKRLKQLRQEGFKIAVDDVGTGNSGLDMLSKVDAEFVKIDRSIVVAAATESNARAVLMAIATFARQTGTFVIAEGIEDGDTLEFLRSIVKDDLSSHTIIQGGQGFGLGRPSHDLSPQSPAILHDGRVAFQTAGMPSRRSPDV
jgi:diguanylate cyclase (GGDEF)-like protein